MNNVKTTAAAVAAVAFAVYMLAQFAAGNADINAVYQAVLAALVALGLYNAADAPPKAK